MGYTPPAQWDARAPSPNPQVTLQLDQWKEARKQAWALMIKAQKCWPHQSHLHHTFKVGDQVWLEGHSLKINQPSTKLATKQYGPFSIEKVLSPTMYQLTLPDTWKIHPVFQMDLLTPYRETELYKPNFTQPSLDLMDEEEEYEVECILNS